MKEAAGEANLTVITIVLIGVVVAVGVVLIPRLMGNTAAKACCTDAGGKWSASGCGEFVNTSGGDEYTSCCTDAGVDKNKCKKSGQQQQQEGGNTGG